jgi:fusobacterium outer membrane protein
MSPKKDYNGALQWTVSGDIFAGINNMKRKFWVVNDVFEAKSDYHSYGAALKNELGYDIRISEKTHLRPYGTLKMEYGRFNSIKEDSGQIRLEVKGNDYFSVKPEAGIEFKYIQPLAVKTNLSVGLTAAYENEIGKLQKGNQARVRYTTADWYNLEKEKEDKRGNGKFDLNIGVDNTRFGVTVNAGYDTKGNNVRGGIGVRLIY